MLPAAAVIAIGLGGLTSPANAAGGVSVSDHTMRISTQAGKVNHLTVQRVGLHYRVTDTGDTVVPGPGCTAVTATQVQCLTAGISALTAELGDGNDSLDVQVGVGTTVNAGPGHDHILGSSRDDVIRGGDGNDTLEGRDGSDSIYGDAGFDSLFGAEDCFQCGGDNAPDFLSGGADLDGVVYIGYQTGVRVSLDGIADDGVPGEGDNTFSDVEAVDGTVTGSDVLIGNGQDNLLGGYGGDDVIAGMGGDDQLNCGPGVDRGNGGTGTDTAHDCERLFQVP